MIPILYERTETEFTTNGLGRLSDAISCTVTQELNGEYELTMVYPIVGIHYKDLAEERIILAIPDNYAVPQQFQIYKITKPLSGQVTVYAQHISYRLSGMVCLPFEVNSAVSALASLKSNCTVDCPFTFITDKVMTANLKVEEPVSIRSVMGEDEGCILDVYGGDYEFNNYTVYLHDHWGNDNGVTIRYGKNLTDITKETDTSETYSGIVPFWKGTDDNDEDYLITLTNPVVWPSDESVYHDRVVPYDMSDYFEDEEGNKVEPTQALLKEAAQAALDQMESWLADTNITVSFAHLWQTEEYKDYIQLERVRICDTVHVIYDEILDGEEATMRVVTTEFDVINERYISIELGEAKNTISNEINVNFKNSIQKETYSMMQEAIKSGTSMITGGLGGFVRLKLNANRKPEEILVMDNEDYHQATYVWRFNKNGIGFSDNGYDGPYKQAWTIDGRFYTDWVTAGKMTANLIKVGRLEALNDAAHNYWDMESGDFKLSSQGSDVGIECKTVNGLRVLNIDATVITSGYLRSRKPSVNDPNFELNLDTGELTVKKGVIKFGKMSLLDGTDGIYVGEDGMSAGYIPYNNNNYGAPSFFCPSTTYANAHNMAAYPHVWGLMFYDVTGNGTVREAGGFITSDSGRIVTGHPMDIGGNNTRTTRIHGGLEANLVSSSDERIKKEITEITPEDAIDFVRKARPVSFRYKDTEKYPDGIHHGLIAQDVKEIRPDWNLVTNSDDVLCIGYTEIIADLLAVVKENLKEIDELKKQVNHLSELYSGGKQ